MKIKRCPVIFHNVISANVKTPLEELLPSMYEFRNTIIKNGLYGTGPVIYQLHNFDEEVALGEYTLYLPVNEPVEIEENEKYTFHEVFQFDDALVLRHADMDEELNGTHAIIQACAQELNFKLQTPFYNIYLDVYGEGIVDVFAPIIEEGTHD